MGPLTLIVILGLAVVLVAVVSLGLVIDNRLRGRIAPLQNHDTKRLEREVAHLREKIGNLQDQVNALVIALDGKTDRPYLPPEEKDRNQYEDET